MNVILTWAREDWLKNQHPDLPVHWVREAVAETLDALSIWDMTCVYFDDYPVNRLMTGKFIGKMWFRKSGTFDTSANRWSEAEEIEIRNSDIIITDINDTNTVADCSGGLRRGEMALWAWKIVVFVSGHGENREIIEGAFSEKYSGQYIFLVKPYDFSELQQWIQNLIAERNARRGETGTGSS